MFIEVREKRKNINRPFILQLNVDQIENVETQFGSHSVYCLIVMASGRKYQVKETQHEVMNMINGVINRVEIIGPKGREGVRYTKENETARIDMQDNGKTLKVFIKDE